MISWSNYCHPTDVVKPVYGIPIFLLTKKAELSKGHTQNSVHKTRARHLECGFLFELHGRIISLAVLLLKYLEDKYEGSWLSDGKQHTIFPVCESLCFLHCIYFFDWEKQYVNVSIMLLPLHVIHNLWQLLLLKRQKCRHSTRTRRLTIDLMCKCLVYKYT